MTVNKTTLDLIKEFEGFRAKAYRDPVGIWTIGYGTTEMAGVGIVPRAGMVISETDATEYLHRALDKFAASIRSKITAPINENEFGAFMSLAYNIGPGAFGKSSALRKFNAGDKAGAANAILLWNKAGGKVLNGLVRRRKEERDLFLAPVTSKPVGDSFRPVNGVKPHVIKTPETVTCPAPHVNWLAALIRAILAIFRR
jgi:lysozyme